MVIGVPGLVLIVRALADAFEAMSLPRRIRWLYSASRAAFQVLRQPVAAAYSVPNAPICAMFPPIFVLRRRFILLIAG